MSNVSHEEFYAWLAQSRKEVNECIEQAKQVLADLDKKEREYLKPQIKKHDKSELFRQLRYCKGEEDCPGGIGEELFAELQRIFEDPDTSAEVGEIIMDALADDIYDTSGFQTRGCFSLGDLRYSLRRVIADFTIRYGKIFNEHD